jgi:hypothetical protein
MDLNLLYFIADDGPVYVNLKHETNKPRIEPKWDEIRVINYTAKYY